MIIDIYTTNWAAFVLLQPEYYAFFVIEMKAIQSDDFFPLSKFLQTDYAFIL
jgi:hypothetical protein